MLRQIRRNIAPMPPKWRADTFGSADQQTSIKVSVISMRRFMTKLNTILRALRIVESDQDAHVGATIRTQI